MHDILVASNKFLRVHKTRDRLIASGHWTGAQYDAAMGDLMPITIDGEAILIDVKQCTTPGCWGELKRSIPIAEASEKRFMGDLYVGCGPKIDEFYVVQRELAIKYGLWIYDRNGDRFKSVDVNRKEFHALRLGTWIAAGAMRQW